MWPPRAAVRQRSTASMTLRCETGNGWLRRYDSHRRERYRPVQRRFFLLPAADRRQLAKAVIRGACREDPGKSTFLALTSSSAGWTEARCAPSKTGSSASPPRPPEDGWRSRPEGCESHGPF